MTTTTMEEPHPLVKAMIDKITTPHQGNPLISGLKCESCGISQEDAGKALLRCGRCNQVYCSEVTVKNYIGRSHTRKFVLRLQQPIRKRERELLRR